MMITHWLDGPAGYNMLNDQYSIAVSVNTDKLGFELDPEALCDWIEEQRPKPRYGVIADGPRASVQDLTLPYTVATFYGRNRKADAEDYAALLNEREATK